MTEPVREVQDAELPRNLAMTLLALQREMPFGDLAVELELTKQTLAYHLTGLRERGVIRSSLWWDHKRATVDGWNVIRWDEPDPQFPHWRVTARPTPRRDGQRNRVPLEAVVLIEPGTANRVDLDDPPPGVMLVPVKVRLSWEKHLDRMAEAGLGWVTSEELRMRLLAAIGSAVNQEVILPAWRATRFLADVKVAAEPDDEDGTDD